MLPQGPMRKLPHTTVESRDLRPSADMAADQMPSPESAPKMLRVFSDEPSGRNISVPLPVPVKRHFSRGNAFLSLLRVTPYPSLLGTTVTVPDTPVLEALIRKKKQAW